MTATEYRTHRSRAIRKAFLRGEIARLVGVDVVSNPYRAQTSTRRPVRGSWSESFARAWSAGWSAQDGDLGHGVTAPAATGGVQEGSQLAEDIAEKVEEPQEGAEQASEGAAAEGEAEKAPESTEDGA